MKRYVALARVSSREQEREGFSLAVQEDALKRYAETTGGEIVKFFSIAETASKTDERKAFRELSSNNDTKKVQSWGDTLLPGQQLYKLKSNFMLVVSPGGETEEVEGDAIVSTIDQVAPSPL